jgi:hypothetical protein
MQGLSCGRLPSEPAQCFLMPAKWPVGSAQGQGPPMQNQGSGCRPPIAAARAADPAADAAEVQGEARMRELGRRNPADDEAGLIAGLRVSTRRSRSPLLPLRLPLPGSSHCRAALRFPRTPSAGRSAVLGILARQ